MKTLLFFVIFLRLLVGLSRAVYKQWIPNTNFENASNWDRNQVPCPNDVIVFGNSEVVSVFVESPHSLTDMYLPMNGEFIMAPGAGFAAFDGNYEPGCETASEIKFTSSGSYQWYDPRLWHSAVSLEDMERGKYMFSVDEECVPCQYDDVLFQPKTSFRVNIESSEQMIHLRSISLMGQKFTDNETLAAYLQSRSAKLQFDGQGAFRLSNDRCPDRSGCECGNAADRLRVCAVLLKDSEDQCPSPTCKNPLKPIGHCCEICGAIVFLDYSTGFDIELYRDRIRHTFLSLPKNAGVKMAISKVHRPDTSLGLWPLSSASFIQIVLMDNRTGSQSGIHAEQLAEDIMNDIAKHGESFDIVGSSLQTATGNNWSAHGVSSHISSSTTGMIIGCAPLSLLLGVLLALYKRGMSSFRSFPCVHLLSQWKRMNDLDSLGEAADKGFDNPMFDTPSSLAALDGAHFAGETPKETGSKNTQVYYINPLYDETELRA
ncbi:protein amnionless [Sphaerodactylus townsendi]|uniref:protein amnionless n=1 Tax=Sphaerodactylus townsendi TaxID=933632 RepID=UPI002027398E|nr:protein amnionless [Sphaerodactylus townsendi]